MRQKICICEKNFRQQSNLREHEKIHGEKGQKCGLCKKTFAQRTALKIHESIHSDEKPYQCSNCEMKFKQGSNLRKHEKIHSGEMQGTQVLVLDAIQIQTRQIRSTLQNTICQ